MNKEADEKIKEDLERLRSMSPEDASDIVKTYHKTFLDKLSENIDSLRQIQTLCPSMISVTETAMIVAERDFLDDRVTQSKDEGLKLCAITGSSENVKKLIEKIWDMIPDVFESVCKEKGYIMSISEKTPMTVEQAANFTGFSKAYIYKLIGAGKIPSYKPDMSRQGKVILCKEELTAFCFQNRRASNEELREKAVKN